ncbi:E3 ubiquitin-protein ligase RNF10 [Dermatophagoides pteronyssinus]|uniref:E3 ubiquitin-protein ligase RNF10 n=1 Tax=Dermatophagoides pteronyssinus TaxID=6956 RepID=UPI003F67C3E4
MDRLTKLSNNEQTGAMAGPSSSLRAQTIRQSSSNHNGRMINPNNNNNNHYGGNRQRFSNQKIRDREHKSSSSNRNGKNDGDNNRKLLTNKIPKVILASDSSIHYGYHQMKRYSYNNHHGKERFVQANCQFVISFDKTFSIDDHPASNYSECLHNPDASIPWESIEEILFTCKTDDNVHCPICLHYPTAAKITRCGHIYCWSCMLHYLSLSDKKSRPCPICFHHIQKNELKSVTIVSKQNHSTNDLITFNLMKIRKGSTFAVPIDYEEQFDHSINIKNFNQTLDMFHKVFIASREQKTQLIEREQNELQQELFQYKADNMPEICFVENALEELAVRKSMLDKNQSQIDESLLNFAILGLKPSISGNNNDYHYFYQSADGQHIYPHSINVRMLKHQYQELRYCPPIIIGKVIELHRQTITDDIRKRFAHLRHLPLSCEFTIAELEFINDEKIVSAETLEQFRTEMNNRHRDRKRREKAQRIRDRNIEIENNKKYFNVHPLPNFSMTDADFQPLEDDDTAAAFALGDGASSSSSSDTPPSTSPALQSSFANMLTSGKTKIQFDNTIRRQQSSSKIEMTNNDEDDNEERVTNLDLTLSDYFDQCVRVGGSNSNGISGGKKQKRKNRQK